MKSQNKSFLTSSELKSLNNPLINKTGYYNIKLLSNYTKVVYKNNKGRKKNFQLNMKRFSKAILE